MEKQKKFTSGYVNHLKNEVERGLSIKNYDESEFIINEDRTLIISNIYKPDNLYGRLRINDDYVSSVAIYEAYSDLNPIQASDEGFWTYLSHVDLFDYLRERWTKEKTSDYLLDHWFIKSSSQSNLLGDNLSGMWWAVKLSVDEDRDDKYELTKILFRQRDFAFRTLGSYKLGRHGEAVKGILEFILENEDLFETRFELKSREVTKFLNLYGGTKPLVYFKKDDFKEVLHANRQIIENVN
jgi:hypothetical protein